MKIDGGIGGRLAYSGTIEKTNFIKPPIDRVTHCTVCSTRLESHNHSGKCHVHLEHDRQNLLYEFPEDYRVDQYGRIIDSDHPSQY